MVFIIGLLTAVMALNCLVLILLVLLQLPKKEAGAGLAFGGGASDALFGAGAGNMLTKITKSLAGSFFGLAVLLSILYNYHVHHGTAKFQDLLAPPAPKSAPATGSPATPGGPVPAAPGALTVPAAGSNSLLPAPLVESTNPAAPTAKPAPAAPTTTNSPATPATPK